MGPPFKLTVEDSLLLKGRGLIATGPAQGEPLPGPVVIRFHDGRVIQGQVLEVERFRVIGNRWGLLLADLTEIPSGAVIESLIQAHGAVT